MTINPFTAREGQEQHMAKSSYRIDSFATAKAAFDRSRTGKIAHNTYLVSANEGAYAVRFHRTNIVTYYPDGSIELNSGGYRSVTTKQRMNQFSPVKVGQKAFAWYVYPPFQSFYAGFRWDSPIEFQDGMIIGLGEALDARR